MHGSLHPESHKSGHRDKWISMGSKGSLVYIVHSKRLCLNKIKWKYILFSLVIELCVSFIIL